MDVSDIFYIFSAWQRGKGSPRRREGGGIFIENPSRGVCRAGGAGLGGRGAERLFAGYLGGGAKFFFWGRNSHQVFVDIFLVAPYFFFARYRETISAVPPYCALWGF